MIQLMLTVEILDVSKYSYKATGKESVKVMIEDELAPFLELLSDHGVGGSIGGGTGLPNKDFNDKETHIKNSSLVKIKNYLSGGVGGTSGRTGPVDPTKNG